MRVISRLFRQLLSVDGDLHSSLLYRMSLSTFASFAELTAHESIVPDSLSTADEHTRQTVVAFLSRVSFTLAARASSVLYLRARLTNVGTLFR